MTKVSDRIIDIIMIKAIEVPINTPWLLIISQPPKIITIELIAPLIPLVNPGFQNTGLEIVLQFEQATLLVRLIIKALRKEALFLQFGHENFDMLKFRELEPLQKNYLQKNGEF